MSLIAELKRRNVFRVGAAYLALAWIATQITGTVAPAFGMPDWTLKLVVWIALLGFPFVLVFAWAYELTPEGLKRESEVDRGTSITPQTGRKLDSIVIGLLVAAIGLFLFGQFRGAAPAVETSRTEVRPVEGTTAEDSAGRASAGQGADVGLKPDLQQSSAVEPANKAVAVAPDDKSIAVLPFADMSASKDQEYMSDGIAEELLNLLAKVPELRVIGRTSSFSYKGKDTKLADVARELNVANILEGSVRTSGNRVRITAQLVRASDSSHLWSETYDRTLDDIFAVQDEIASAVVAQLKIALLGSAEKKRQIDPAMYSQFLLARQLRVSASLDARQKAVSMLQDMLAKDPGYAEAWVELAANYRALASNGALPFAEGYEKARVAASKAIELEPSLASAHAALGSISWDYDGNAAEAARYIARAVALAPSDSDALYSAANFALGIGRLDTALALARFRQQREPVDPGSQRMLGYIALYSGLYDEALAARRNALALDAGGTGNHYYIGLALLLKGEAAAAYAEFEQDNGTWRMLGLVLGHFANGRKAESDAVLKELTDSKDADSWAYNLAYLHAFRGEADLAFQWLERAVEVRDPGLGDVAVDPQLANIHDDPRWLPFLRKLGRAPEQLAAIPFDVKLP